MPEGRNVFKQFRAFSISTSMDMTEYQYGWIVLYFFYNIVQTTSTKK